MEKKKIKAQILLVFLITSSLILIFGNIYNKEISIKEVENVKSSAQVSETKQWIKNPTFESPIEPTWFWKNGTEGDNSDIIAFSNPGEANFKVLGQEETITLISGTINSSNSPGWGIFNNSDFLLPDLVRIDSSGGYVYHYLDESTGPGQVHNFPSVHFKTNISMPVDMSDYEITNVSLEVIINASVNINVDSYNDWNQTDNTPYIDWDKFLIGDSANFYVEFSDLNNSYPFRVGDFETRDVALGQGDRTGYPDILNITNRELDYVDNQDIISAMSSVLEADNQNLTITLGLDIYCEDNKAAGGGDQDLWNYLIFRSFNLTVTYVKKIDQFTTISWNQIGNQINGTTSQVQSASFNFNYKINQTWPTLAPLSEIRFNINDNILEGSTIKLSSAKTTYQKAMNGSFDVTSLIQTDVNISVSIEIFIKDSFSLNQSLTISIDDAYLNITYIKTIPDIQTEIELFLEKANKTSDRFIEVPYGKMLNITAKYKTLLAVHIQNATVELDGIISGPLIENISNQQYTILINTTQMGLGSKTFTITTQKNLYESQNIQFLVDVIERKTELQLFINGTEKFDNSTIGVITNEIVNITVYYRDNLTNAPINGATVTLLDVGSLNETLNYYNFSLNTTNLELGINIFTVLAQRNNYESKTIQFILDLTERVSEIQLFVNNIPQNDNDIIQVQIDQNINVTVLYSDNLTKSHLSQATITLIGVGALNETLNQYTITMSSNDLAQEVTIFTIFAQLQNFQSQTIRFLLELTERSTEIKLYINGVKTNNSESVSVEMNENLNITLYYRDFNNQTHLSGASVTLLGVGALNEVLDYYSIIINTSDLVQKITIFTVFAQYDNYQPQSIQFLIELSERSTQLILFINGINKTLDPVFELPLRSMLNITVKYLDSKFKTHIAGATIQLIGEGLSTSLTENVTLEQYFFMINTSNLDVGIKIFSIIAQASDYKVNSIDPRITINKIKTQINIVNGDVHIVVNSGGDARLTLLLNNTDYGGSIKGAILTYSWDYGQDQLSDPDGDGVYEGVLRRIPEGTYIITITASVGDDYVITSFEITITALVRQGPDITLIIISLFGGVLVLGIGIGLYLTHFRYSPIERKIRKLRKKIKSGKKVKKPIPINERIDVVKKLVQSSIAELDIGASSSEDPTLIDSIDKLQKNTEGSM